MKEQSRIANCLRSNQRGATTVYFLLFTLILLGFSVMATDFGRLYVIQGELQAAADAAALAAATRLVGTTNALLRAEDQVTASFDSTTGNDNRFNLRMNQVDVSGASGLVTTRTIDYFSTLLDALGNVNAGQNGPIDWTTGVYPKYVRVLISTQAPVVFVPLLNRTVSSLPTITVSAVAGISAPMCTACGIEGLAVVDQAAGEDPVNYGFTPGSFYTLSLTGAGGTVQYVLLNHVPNGPADLDVDSSLFDLAAGGISSSPGLTIPGVISVDTTETVYPDLPGNAAVARDILCGLNLRFGVDPSQNANCAAVEEFATLATLFSADTDVAPEPDMYAAGPGLQDFATEYDGNYRRVLTMAVVDSTASLNVLNFRQFLIEPAPTTAGLNTAAAAGAFRAQYIGSLVPLRCGTIGGMCTASSGVGRVVLH